MAEFAFEPLAEDACLLRFGNGIDAATNARVHAAARALRAAALPGVIDIAPAYATLLVRFDPLAGFGNPDTPSSDPAAGNPSARVECLRAAIGDVLAKSSLSPGPVAGEGWGEGAGASIPIGAHSEPHSDRPAPSSPTATQPKEIPVCYGGDHGPDLAAVAAHAGLTVEAVIARHAAGEYTVAMLGFAPGFPYLLGLDPALQAPRRASPRTRVPAGSVAIGGAQTGIYPRELPGGWNLIGRTPVALFDARRDPPGLLAPGDRVRFRAISADAFARATAAPP